MINIDGKFCVVLAHERDYNYYYVSVASHHNNPKLLSYRYTIWVYVYN